MEQQGDHVPKGHFVLQALLSLILVVLEPTVRALVERVTKTVSCAILDTSVLGKNLRHQKDHVTLGIIAQRGPSYGIRQLLPQDFSLQWDLQSHSLAYQEHINHMRSKVTVALVNQGFIVLQRA